jgi:SAM-dependent methyltransferase
VPTQPPAPETPYGPPAVLWHCDYVAALPSYNWVSAPRYLLLRDLLLRIFRDLPARRLLQFGCGAGVLLGDLSRKGFSAVEFDQSVSAGQQARVSNADAHAIRIAETADGEVEASIDYLAAFEVLEHIEDDPSALCAWAKDLRRGGRPGISVPGYPERWKQPNVWAGHFRRSRRAWFEKAKIQPYGFSLANAMERLAAPIYAHQTCAGGAAEMSLSERTGQSRSASRLLTCLWPFHSSLSAVLAIHMILELRKRFCNSHRSIGSVPVAREV